MKFKKLLVTTFSVVGIAVGGAGLSPVHAQISAPTTEEDACRQALEVNTIEALEEFLRNFPNGSSACRALALNSLGSFQGADDDPEPGDGGPEAGYGG